MKNKSNKKKKGFTLIELLVVVLIIGVLAAIALPMYSRSAEKSKMVQGVSTLTEIAKAQALYSSRRGQYTSNIFNLSIDLEDFSNEKNSATGSSFGDGYFNYTVYGEDLQKAIATRQTGGYELEINYETGELICRSEDNKCSILNLPTEYEGSVPPSSPVSPSIINPDSPTPPDGPTPPDPDEPTPPEPNTPETPEGSGMLSCTGNLLFAYYGYANATYADMTCKYKGNEYGGYDILTCSIDEVGCFLRSYDANRNIIEYKHCSSLDSNGECIVDLEVNLGNKFYDDNGHLKACEIKDHTTYTDGCLRMPGMASYDYKLSMVYETDTEGRVIKAIPCDEFNDDYTCKTYSNATESLSFEYDESGRVKSITGCAGGSMTLDNGDCKITLTNELVYDDPDSVNADKTINCGFRDGVKSCYSWEYIKDERGFVTQVRSCGRDKLDEDGNCKPGGYFASYISEYDEQGRMISAGYTYTLDEEGNPIGDVNKAHTYKYGDDGSYFVYDHENKKCKMITPTGAQVNCEYHE